MEQVPVVADSVALTLHLATGCRWKLVEFNGINLLMIQWFS